MEHLMNLWEKRSPLDEREGCRAFQNYNAVLKSFAVFYGVGIIQAVEAFAATSPNSDYHGNLRSTASVLYDFKNGGDGSGMTVGTYKACGLRALSYVNNSVSFLETVKGPKITAFRHNLLYPYTSKQVTVDGHMFAAWIGEALTMKEAEFARRKIKGAYNTVARQISAIAKHNRLLPHQVQATLWISRKRINSIKYQSQHDIFHPDDLSKINCQPRDYPPFGDQIQWRKDYG